MIKPALITAKSDTYPLAYLHKTLKSSKAPYLCPPVKAGTERIEYSILTNSTADLKAHFNKLAKYLEKNPNDIEARVQLANLREMFK